MDDRIAPFSQFLKKNIKFIRKKYYEKDFEGIKRYLINPYMLTPVDHSNPLYFYVLSINHALGEILVQKNNEVHERAIYYLSKTLQDCEKIYYYRDVILFYNPCN